MKGKAPCGHVGEYVIGQFVWCPTCDVSDGIPLIEIDDNDAKTKPLCGHCGSSDVEIWPDFVINGNSLYHCHSCSTSFQVKV